MHFKCWNFAQQELSSLLHMFYDSTINMKTNTLVMRDNVHVMGIGLKDSKPRMPCVVDSYNATMTCRSLHLNDSTLPHEL